MLPNSVCTNVNTNKFIVCLLFGVVKQKVKRWSHCHVLVMNSVMTLGLTTVTTYIYKLYIEFRFYMQVAQHSATSNCDQNVAVTRLHKSVHTVCHT